MEIDKRKIDNKNVYKKWKLINGKFVIKMFLIKDKLKINDFIKENLY